MRLAAVLSGWAEPIALAGVERLEVSGVSCDSRTTEPGDLFVALPGTTTHGVRFAADAVARGAVAVAASEPVALDVPVLRTAEPARLLGHVASRLAGDPSHALCIAGVTGTNGKTTTTHLLEGIWRAAGREPGVIGTIAYRYAGRARPAPHTTPTAPVLHRLLADMRAAGTTHVAMELSSHALAQERVAGLQLDAALFTNLTRDHLDFHGDMEAYFAAKARLFTELLPASAKAGRVAVVNVDTEPGRRLAAMTPGRVVRAGRAPDADVRLADATTSLAGSRGCLIVGGERIEFETPLVGSAHLENVVLAAAAAWALGVAWSDVLAGLRSTPAPPGRVEQIAGPGFTVVVDYAHSPDALERVLAALRPLTPGRLICVFGCGGDRDRGKRPLMGEAAARASDLVVLTSDNPRTEPPERILADIEVGVRAAGMRPVRDAAAGRGYLVEADRRLAIERAIAAARPGDVVLVAGKGHEDYQIVGTERRHLDDREEVRRALGARA
ncbi:MAG TPA: UDP-N-acetylmuramoyl-L-alanyl-D-glutamate--2,6-diaminopimelate ligase [Candidatus Limnocylindria bacterium]|nr:UDP-N-acetylmuramoyl-L-alanyl-D-glutamate--2,6-diaminopimelate ligase [Candidatus Limnocylindria bacterium]